MQAPKLPGERGLKWIVILAVVGVIGLVVGFSALVDWLFSAF